jgi:hypothetical protein
MEASIYISFDLKLFVSDPLESRVRIDSRRIFASIHRSVSALNDALHVRLL